jgi:hypothetical protein
VSRQWAEPRFHLRFHSCEKFAYSISYSNAERPEKIMRDFQHRDRFRFAARQKIAAGGQLTLLGS